MDVIVGSMLGEVFGPNILAYITSLLPSGKVGEWILSFIFGCFMFPALETILNPCNWIPCPHLGNPVSAIFGRVRYGAFNAALNYIPTWFRGYEKSFEGLADLAGKGG
ncbi:MAG: hypothetical protein MASP_00074 [Candidatus Methanolliviera sp. GoM_asphalt]|nr:MAG: hypothetical protein MASP_00074 [Candidatus Methanolliviera sp. GoM_asphalt]